MALRLATALAALGVALLLTAAGPVRRAVLGRSLGGRPVRAIGVGDSAGRTRVLVVGCIHGDECAGIAIADRLERLAPSRGVQLWVVPDLNPDGQAAGSRGNARGVDLNRNFPWHWRRLGGIYDSGPRPLSEPESRFAYRLILRLRPRITIWFHQHLSLVDESGGDVAIERRFAGLTGLPLARLTRYPGSVASWENARLPGTTAFVVELPPGRLSPAETDRYARAVLELAR